MEEFDDLRESLRAYRAHNVEPTADALAKREVAHELRALSHDIATSAASAEQLREIAAQLRAQHEILTGAIADSELASPDASVPLAGMADFRDRSPVTGHANPMAPPVTLAPDLDLEVVTGEVTFGRAFEGAPGCVHGGFVAALLDEALGMACVFGGAAGMTAELTTRYRRHTPVATPLRVEARLVSVDGRKLRSSGEIYDGDIVVAEATGLFIAVNAAKFEQLAADKSDREV